MVRYVALEQTLGTEFQTEGEPGLRILRRCEDSLFLSPLSLTRMFEGEYAPCAVD